MSAYGLCHWRGLRVLFRMNDPIEALETKLREAEADAGKTERHVIEHVKKRLHISRDVGRELDASTTFGQRIADRVASFGGSWTFILLFLAFMAAWIGVNAVVLTRMGKPFDPYPFIFLNLVLSMVAALQAPVIMMSQNRHAAKDRRAAEHDYEVNLKSELEILGLHAKVDALRERQWIELVEMQNRQIQLLTKLVEARSQG
jgi:uncharacterized membrane protein